MLLFCVPGILPDASFSRAVFPSLPDAGTHVLPFLSLSSDATGQSPKLMNKGPRPRTADSLCWQQSWERQGERPGRAGERALPSVSTDSQPDGQQLPGSLPGFLQSWPSVPALSPVAQTPFLLQGPGPSPAPTSSEHREPCCLV